MKKWGVVTAVLILALLLAAGGGTTALAQEVMSTTQSTEFLIDDFNAGQRNSLGGRASNFERAPSSCKFSFSTEEKMGPVGKSLKLNFVKKSVGGPYGMGGYCGYYSILAVGEDFFDAAAYNAITLYVKGDRPGINFTVGIADEEWYQKGDSIKSAPANVYLSQGVTTNWQKIVIPLSDFGDLDFSKLGSVAIVFMPGEGSLYVEDWKFEILPDDDLVIKPYPDGITEWMFADFEEGLNTALGGRVSKYQQAPSTANATAVEDGMMGKALKIEFNRASAGGPYGGGGWCGVYAIVKRGDLYTDVSPFNALRFWVRGEKGGEVFEIGMADEYWDQLQDSVKAGTVDVYAGGPLTTEWTQVTVPFDDFGFLDWEKIGSLSFNFPSPGEGVVYIDQIEFVNTGE